MKKHTREVFVINPQAKKTVKIIGLESESPISAGDALDAASKHMKESGYNQTHQLKVYC